MRGIARTFSAIMLVVGMMASSLVPVLAQDGSTGTPVEQVQPTPTDEVVPTEVDVVEPTEVVEPTQAVQPTDPEVAQPTQEVVAPTPTEDDGDFQAASISYGYLTFTTSDGGNVPRGTQIAITDVTGGGSTAVMFTSLVTTLASGQTIVLSPYEPLPANTVIQLDISANGYLPFSQSYDLGDSSPFDISANLQAAAQVSPTLTITTQLGGSIPAGTLIAVTNTSDDDAVLYQDELIAPANSGLTPSIPAVAENSVLQVSITDAAGYDDFSQTFTITTSNNTMAAALQVMSGAFVSGGYRLYTSDYADIPVGTVISVYDITGGTDTLLQTLPATTAPLPYGSDFSFSFDPPLAPNSSIRIEVTATGYLPIADTFNLGNIYFSVSGELQKASTQVYPTLTITTEGGGDIPAGTLIQVINTSDNDALVYGEGVAADTPSGKMVNVPPVDENSVLEVSITGAAGYFDVDQHFTVTPANSAMAVTLQSSQVYSTLTITTSDGGDIPAGTLIQVLNTSDSNALVYGEGVATDTPSGKVVNVPPVTSDSVLEVVISSANGYHDLDQTFTITTATTTMAVELQKAPDLATVDITISMTDGGLIPDGMTWSFQQTDYTEIEGGTVPSGSASGWTVSLTNPVPEGNYVLLVRTPGDLYYYFYVVGVNAPATTLPVVFDRVQGDVTATFVTSDGGDVPTGATWAITDADSNVVQSGTLSADLPTGSLLPNTNPLDYGTYILTVDADGYLPYAYSFTVNQASLAFDIGLQANPPTKGAVNLTVTTSDGGAIPTGTIITIGGVSYVVSDLLTVIPVSAADAASGTTFTLMDVPEGTQPLTVTNAAPYADASDTVTVVAGETIEAAVVLQLAAVPSPTVTNPTVTPTAVPAQPTPGGDHGHHDRGTKTGGKSTISALPNTGQGTATQDGMNTALLALAAALLLAGVAGIVGVRTRRTER